MLLLRNLRARTSPRHALLLAGYHRMFAHKAFRVQRWFEWVLACMGAAAVEGSIKWWSRDHRCVALMLA